MMPDRLRLGGEESFGLYAEHFRRLYQSGDVIRDVLGRAVTFDVERCRHVCFKEDPALSRDPLRRYERSIWSQDRAECITWIMRALADPDEIRVNHAVRRHQAYLIALPSVDMREPPLRYYVSVELTRDAGWVKFETAFCPDLSYWKAARRSAKGDLPIYKRRGRR